MDKIKVLIVDDSVVIRKLLTDILSQDPEIEVVGTAPNGRIGLAKIPQLNPDIVTLDIEMPVMDGLTTLPELRQKYPKLPVIMFSTLTERGAAATMDALARGASDYVAKPANVGSVAAGIQSVKQQLIPKIRSLGRNGRGSEGNTESRTTAPPMSNRTLRSSIPRRIDIVVIGSSTGGPQALSVVLKQLPADFPIPVAVVQHMPPVFTRHLANRLDQDLPLEVVEATEGDLLRPGRIHIAPGDYHLELGRVGVFTKVLLNQGTPENSCRPAVDVLFRSAAAIYGPGCLGVVLTGMGQDGLRGGQAIVQAGGSLIAQDQETSVVWGMPRAVADAGIASKVLPLDSIGKEIVLRAAYGRRAVGAVTQEST